MNTMTVLIGVLATLFGAATVVLRHTHPQWFKKLGPMKAAWGAIPGYVVHFIGYSLVPLVLGISMIIHGMNGGSLLDR